MIDRLLSTSSHEERVSIIRSDARKRMVRFLIIAVLFIAITIGRGIANKNADAEKIDAVQIMQILGQWGG
jgi:hypothetical protein